MRIIKKILNSIANIINFVSTWFFKIIKFIGYTVFFVIMFVAIMVMFFIELLAGWVNKDDNKKEM